MAYLVGFHTVLWLQGGSSTAKLNVTVNTAFETLVEPHVLGEEAQESLYVMCNNSQDVASLQRHTEAWKNRTEFEWRLLHPRRVQLLR